MGLQDKAPEIGLVLGAVFVIMGFAYSNSGVWMLGFVFLAIGGFTRSTRGGGRPS